MQAQHIDAHTNGKSHSLKLKAVNEGRRLNFEQNKADALVASLVQGGGQSRPKRGKRVKAAPVSGEGLVASVVQGGQGRPKGKKRGGGAPASSGEGEGGGWNSYSYSGGGYGGGGYNGGGYGGGGGYLIDGQDWSICDKDCGWCGRCMNNASF